MPRQPRLLTLFALTCALFLRIWVPMGWMPAASGGAFAIELCSAAAPMPMSHSGGHHDSSQKGQHGGDCAFAPHHAGMAAADIEAPLLQPTLIPAPDPQQPASSIFTTGPPAPPPPATGPPAIA